MWYQALIPIIFGWIGEVLRQDLMHLLLKKNIRIYEMDQPTVPHTFN